MKAQPWWQRPLFLVICGGLIMGLSLGARHVQGLFLVPMTMDRGWTREAFGFAIALQNLIWGLAQPFTGMIADRFGSAKVIGAGTIIYGIGLYLMAYSTTEAQFAVTAGLLVGVALSGTAFGAVYGALSRIIAPEKRSWALGAAGAIGGLGQFVMVPAAQGLIDGFGWVAALIAIGVIVAVLTPFAAPLRDNPGAVSTQQDQSIGAAVREAFLHRGFILLNLGFIACGFQLAFIGTHLPAYLLDQGLTASHAVNALALIALANVVGTYYAGYLGGLYRRKYLLAILYLVRAGIMALFVMLPPSAYTLYPFAIVMGLAWLGAVPLTNGLISQIFGVRYITTLFGFVFFGHQVGSFFGVWLGGYVFDTTGSYDLIWFGAIALGVIAALLHWPIDDRQVERLAPAGSPA